MVTTKKSANNKGRWAAGKKEPSPPLVGVQTGATTVAPIIYERHAIPHRRPQKLNVEITQKTKTKGSI